MSDEKKDVKKDIKKDIKIEVKNVSKKFNTKEGLVDALSDINLTIEEGDIYGIIGMSGAGKSTLVRCLNLLEKPSGGQVLIDGRDLTTLSDKELREERKNISMIFQHFNLLMQKNVIDNVCFPLLIHGTKKAEAKKRALELLKIVGLEDKAKVYPSQLSGGQKQRVAIARALASDPKILLCDEATSALDPQTTTSILELLKSINEQMNITIVIITHQMSVIREICNKVAIIENGKIAEDGEVKDIFNNPKSAVGKRLIYGDSASVTDYKQLLSYFSKNDAKRIRIVFSENSSFEPVIANLIMAFKTPVNIIKADTRNVLGYAKGEMILQLPEDKNISQAMCEYLLERGLSVEEVGNNVE